MFPLKCRLLSWPTLPGLFPFLSYPLVLLLSASLKSFLQLNIQPLFCFKALHLLLLLLGILCPCWACLPSVHSSVLSFRATSSERPPSTHTHTPLVSHCIVPFIPYLTLHFLLIHLWTISYFCHLSLQ